ncbi:MAG: GNAT family N-acetyltransferase [Thermoanaerobaculia bacterium]
MFEASDEGDGVTAASEYPYADLALSRRLERAEGRTNLDFVQARARIDSRSGACALERAGVMAMFDRVGSPLTQTFGLGLFQPATNEDLDAIEEFFTSLGAQLFHEVSPLADGTALALLNERGYQPIEATSVMFRPIAPQAAMPAESGKVRVRIAARSEAALWSETAARGWAQPELTEFLKDIGSVTVASEGMTSFFAELDGVPIATGGLSIQEGVALLAGASTLPERRKLGAQRALLDGRLRYAVDQGCDLAMMCAAPGSTSQRNAERQGFRIAYTRLKWERRPTPKD